jgi:hypothetical protein
MIARRNKWASIAFAGGAALAVLSGCAQAPPTYQAAPPGYFDGWAAQQNFDAMRAYLEQQQRAETYFQPEPAPVTQAAPPMHRYRPPPSDDNGPVISENPPAGSSAPVPQTSDRPECSGWWRLCHFL